MKKIEQYQDESGKPEFRAKNVRLFLKIPDFLFITFLFW